MNIGDFKKVLVLAPHTDDGELGAGGTIAWLIENQSEVYYAAFSTAEESVPNNFPKNILKIEVKNATERLGIKNDNLFIYDYAVRKLNYVRQQILEDLIHLRNKINPDLVIMPCFHDIHQDHFTVASEGIRAFKQKTIIGYELIWNNLTFSPACFVSLQQRHIQLKCKALKAYESQQHRDYMTDEFTWSIAKVRGVQIGSPYAEAFEVVRLII